MKKILGISLLAMVVSAPALAGTARTISANENVSSTANNHIATTSYVAGAYNVNNGQINALITDTAVQTGTYNCITSGDTVGSNLEALDACIEQAASDIQNAQIQQTITPNTVNVYHTWNSESTSQISVGDTVGAATLVIPEQNGGQGGEGGGQGGEGGGQGGGQA